MDKTKAISPLQFAEISVYLAGIPVLLFLILKHNWKDKLKWVCFFLLIANFSSDLVGAYLSQIPVASGRILDATPVDSNLHRFRLVADKGSLHPDHVFKTGRYSGIISRVAVDDSLGMTVVTVDGNNASIQPNSQFKSYSNIRSANIFLAIELTLIFTLFYLIFESLPLWRKIVLATLIGSIILWVIRNLVMGKIHSYGGYFTGTTTILIILFALVFYYKQIARPESLFIYATPAFWIVTAILIYRAGTFFLFLYSNNLEQEEKENFFIINTSLYTIQNLLFTIAFINRGPRKLSEHRKPISIR